MIVEIIRDTPWTIRASGSIDLSNVSSFREAIDEAVLQFPQGFIIDLSQAEYLDSAGVMAIIHAYQRIHTCGGKLALITVKSTVREILEIVHIEKLPGIFVYEDLASAMSLFADQQESAGV